MFHFRGTTVSPAPFTRGNAVFPETVGRYAIGLAVVIGIVAALYVLAGATGIVVPGFIVNLLWIVLAVALVVGVIYFLLRLWRAAP